MKPDDNIYFARLLNFAKKYFQSAISFCRSFFLFLKNSFPNYKENALKAALPVLIIAIGFYSCSLSKKQISRNLHDIFVIAEEIRTAFANKPDYWGLSTDFVIRNRIISRKYVKNSRLILGGGMIVSVGSGKNSEPVMPGTAQFDISAHNLTKTQCISYAESVLSKEQLLALEKIEIINETGDYIFTWGGSLPLPVRKYAGKDLCIDGKNTVIWSIK